MALAHQAAQLYLALYFVPSVLHKDPALMRTLVDRCSLTDLPKLGVCCHLCVTLTTVQNAATLALNLP